MAKRARGGAVDRAAPGAGEGDKAALIDRAAHGADKLHRATHGIGRCASGSDRAARGASRGIRVVCGVNRTASTWVGSIGVEEEGHGQSRGWNQDR